MQLLLAVMFHVVLIVVVFWDLYAVFYGRNDETVSLIVRMWSEDRPILPFFVGVVIGHLFWGNTPTPAQMQKNGGNDLAVKCQLK